jgi:Cu(I)/Ag(I) efflux system membrane fusion protein
MEKNINKKKNVWIWTAFAVIFITIATALFSGVLKGTGSDKDGENQASAKMYVCSMHPQVLQDHPGDCPICGMFLIEKIEEDKNMYDTTLNDVVLHVNESVLGSVSTFKVEYSAHPVNIEASGIITFDPRKIRTISSRFKGVIEKSFIKYQFQPVKKGQKLYQVYCPEIYVEKWNYVKLIQTYPDQENLTAEALEWFRLQGLTKGQIDSLKHAVKPEYHLPVYSDTEGYAVSPDFNPDSYFSLLNDETENAGIQSYSTRNIGLNEGVTIESGTRLFSIVDPKFLRADLRVSTEYIGLLKAGQEVNITDPVSHQQYYKGVISEIEPLNGGLFQLVKVYLKNNASQLLPGKEVNSTFITGDHHALWVPESSVVDLGLRKSIFEYHNGRFVAVPVRTGMRTGGKVEILSGIMPGAEVALNGLMLIDSDGFVAIN